MRDKRERVCERAREGLRDRGRARETGEITPSYKTEIFDSCLSHPLQVEGGKDKCFKLRRPSAEGLMIS